MFFNPQLVSAGQDAGATSRREGLTLPRSQRRCQAPGTRRALPDASTFLSALPSLAGKEYIQDRVARPWWS